MIGNRYLINGTIYQPEQISGYSAMALGDQLVHDLLK
jgi:hypothetical protein